MILPPHLVRDFYGYGPRNPHKRLKCEIDYASMKPGKCTKQRKQKKVGPHNRKRSR